MLNVCFQQDQMENIIQRREKLFRSWQQGSLITLSFPIISIFLSSVQDKDVFPAPRHVWTWWRGDKYLSASLSFLYRGKTELNKRMAVNPLLPRAVAGTKSNKCDWSDDSWFHWIGLNWMIHTFNSMYGGGEALYQMDSGQVRMLMPIFFILILKQKNQWPFKKHIKLFKCVLQSLVFRFPNVNPV